MRRCLLCGQKFAAQLSLRELFLLSKKPEQVICFHCRSKFVQLKSSRCQICSKELDSGQICSDCEAWKRKYTGNLLRNYAVFRYNDAFHELMVNYKRYGDYILRKVLQELCWQELGKHRADFYVPIPTAPEHIQQRQFDTISAIFADLVPLTTVLGKKSGVKAQGEKTRKERLLSKQSFFVLENTNINFNFKKVLLLDDIYTTGRTLYHARNALLTAFPQAKITSFSICR